MIFCDPWIKTSFVKIVQKESIIYTHKFEHYIMIFSGLCNKKINGQAMVQHVIDDCF